jgi:HK97 family phage prohead protease
MNYKQLSYDIKDFDEKQGIVKAYANAYNYKDSQGDISAPGSFTKTVQENYKRIRVLKDHNSTVGLGVPLEMDSNDPVGLMTTTKFNLNKEVSRDMFSDIQLMKENGLNAELSIGYGIVDRSKSNTKVINQYKLYEYSFLTSWAANEMSTVTDIKSLKSHYGIMEILTKAYDLKYSDSRLIQIESILKSLSEEPEDTTHNDKPIDKTELKNALLTTFSKY